MPAPKQGARLGSGPDHQKLLLAGICTSLFRQGSVKTTVARARAARPLAERHGHELVVRLPGRPLAVRGDGAPEMDGESATASLAVIRAGIVSAREGRRVEVAEMLSKD